MRTTSNNTLLIKTKATESSLEPKIEKQSGCLKTIDMLIETKIITY